MNLPQQISEETCSFRSLICVVATLEFGAPTGKKKRCGIRNAPSLFFSTRTRLKRKDIFFLTILFQTRSSPIENIMKILARAVGRRKEAVAQVQLVPGTGQFIINNQPAADYLQGNAFSLLKIKEPFEALIILPPPLAADADAEAAPMDTLVKVKGGGLIGQVDAIKLGVARALCKLPQSLVIERRKLLRNFLTQDSRVKERKKYGLVKSRKAKQFSKR